MSTSFTLKRIKRELSLFDTIDTIVYKLYMDKNLFVLEMTYKKKYLKVFFCKTYPFKPPYSIFVNDINIDTIYKKIMQKNNDIKECLCCKSLLCPNNWSANLTFRFNVLKEIDQLILYQHYYIYKRLLTQIINKYSNQEMQYLFKYLLL